jgi:hypothetical protein
MGARLTEYYEQAKKINVEAKLKLVMLTKMTSDEAAAAPDSPDNIAKFESALATLRKAA